MAIWIRRGQGCTWQQERQSIVCLARRAGRWAQRPLRASWDSGSLSFLVLSPTCQRGRRAPSTLHTGKGRSPGSREAWRGGQPAPLGGDQVPRLEPASWRHGLPGHAAERGDGGCKWLPGASGWAEPRSGLRVSRRAGQGGDWPPNRANWDWGPRPAWKMPRAHVVGLWGLVGGQRLGQQVWCVVTEEGVTGQPQDGDGLSPPLLPPSQAWGRASPCVAMTEKGFVELVVWGL